jgi:hypothetical protein
MKYIKNIQNNPKFDQGVSNNVGWLQKKMRQKKNKNKKQKIIPRVPFVWHSGKSSSPSARNTALGEGPSRPV